MKKELWASVVLHIIFVHCLASYQVDSKKKSSDLFGFSSKEITEELALFEKDNFVVNQEKDNASVFAWLEKVDIVQHTTEVFQNKDLASVSGPIGFKIVAKSSKKRRKKFECLLQGCSSAFDTPYKLKRHLISHTHECPFKCLVKQCSQSLIQRAVLKEHLKMHERKGEITEDQVKKLYESQKSGKNSTPLADQIFDKIVKELKKAPAKRRGIIITSRNLCNVDEQKND